MNKKEIFGWSIYDFANTIFSALFVTIYFPLLIVLKGGTAFHVGVIVSSALLIAGFVVPYVGAIIDLTKQKKQLLYTFTVLCCAATFLTSFFTLSIAMVLGLLAILFYHLCLDVYDSMLVDIAPKSHLGRISGIGTAVGYGGTILAVIVAFFVTSQFGETVKGLTLMFIATALLFYIFALPTFSFIRPRPTKPFTKNVAKRAFWQVISTIKGIKKYQMVWLFLLASFLYADGVNTAIIFLFLFARDQLGLTVLQFLPIFLMMAVVAGIGSLVFGHFSDIFGAKKTLMSVLILWIGVITHLYFNPTFQGFFLTGLLGGALLGGIWTLTRPMLISLAPKHKIAELFGYQGLTEKFSGVIGPVVFGYVATVVGFRDALLVVIALFVLGALTLAFVPHKRSA